MARKAKIDNAFLKRLERKEARREKDTKSKRVYFLIVCEGEKTEPNYFNAIRDDFPIGTIAIVDIEGTGKNTLGIIDECISIRDKSFKKYDRIWAVFDRDSFPAVNFDSAINKAEANNIKCAWTNEAFELWFLLHFQFVNTPMSRDSYKSYLEREVRRKGITNYAYLKNSSSTYNVLKSRGNINQAIAWAKLLEDVFTDRSYSTHNPCTKVHLLIEELNNPEKIITLINDSNE
jgi:hypothetical protein